MLEKNRQTLLHLSLIPGVGPATILKIIKKLLAEKYSACRTGQLLDQRSFVCQVSLGVLYRYKSADFVKKLAMSNSVATAIEHSLADKKLLEDELALIEKYKITLLTLFDEEYPELLRQIYMPPAVLYVKGSSLNNRKAHIAFVGARKADSYALQVMQDIIYMLNLMLHL